MPPVTRCWLIAHGRSSLVWARAGTDGGRVRDQRRALARLLTAISGRALRSSPLCHLNRTDRLAPDADRANDHRLCRLTRTVGFS